jgi:histone deacetylase complex regulatory component SIN3
VQKLLGSILIVLVLSGCCTPDIRTEYKEVKIPIAVPCAVEVPTAPKMYFSNIAESASIFEKVKALLADRKLYDGYIEELSGALDSCRK